MNQNDEVEEKIILAALHVIDTEGLEAATVRRIAEVAGVNVAAISYYFRGKKRLFERSFQRSLSNAFNFQDFAKTEHAGPKERLIDILDGVCAMALRFPGLAQAHFNEPLFKGDYSGYSMQRVSSFLDEIVQDLTPRYSQPPNPDELRVALAQIISATLVVASILPGFPIFACGLDISNPEIRKTWLSGIVEKILC